MGGSCSKGSKTTDPDKAPYGPGRNSKRGSKRNKDVKRAPAAISTPAKTDIASKEVANPKPIPEAKAIIEAQPNSEDHLSVNEELNLTPRKRPPKKEYKYTPKTTFEIVQESIIASIPEEERNLQEQKPKDVECGKIQPADDSEIEDSQPEGESKAPDNNSEVVIKRRDLNDDMIFSGTESREKHVKIMKESQEKGVYVDLPISKEDKEFEITQNNNNSTLNDDSIIKNFNASSMSSDDSGLMKRTVYVSTSKTTVSTQQTKQSHTYITREMQEHPKVKVTETISNDSSATQSNVDTVVFPTTKSNLTSTSSSATQNGLRDTDSPNSHGNVTTAVIEPPRERAREELQRSHPSSRSEYSEGRAPYISVDSQLERTTTPQSNPTSRVYNSEDHIRPTATSSMVSGQRKDSSGGSSSTESRMAIFDAMRALRSGQPTAANPPAGGASGKFTSLYTTESSLITDMLQSTRNNEGLGDSRKQGMPAARITGLSVNY